MNVLILGDGDEELAWARWLLGRPEHRLDAAFPGFADASMAGIPAPRDLEDALARPGVEAIIVGGPLESRGEWLRRAAAEGYAIIVLHPPGPDSEAYYQVSLSRDETGAVVVPDLALRYIRGSRPCAVRSHRATWARSAACGSRRPRGRRPRDWSASRSRGPLTPSGRSSARSTR